MPAESSGRMSSRLARSAVPGIGASTMARIVVKYKSLQGALDAGPRGILAAGDELQLRQEARDYLARDPDLEELGLWAVGAAKEAGARVVVLGDPWYPTRLLEIAHPPALLYVRGNLARDVRRIAVVGSREADEQGLEL